MRRLSTRTYVAKLRERNRKALIHTYRKPRVKAPDTPSTTSTTIWLMERDKGNIGKIRVHELLTNISSEPSLLSFHGPPMMLLLS